MSEMTGLNYTLDAARIGSEKQRQLSRKEKVAAGNVFPRLTAPADGWPVHA